MLSSMIKKATTSWGIALSITLLLTGLGFIVTIILEDRLSPMRTYLPQLHKLKNSIAALTKQEHREETEEALQACSRPRQKYVFIAPHKVGASTTCTIFQRYAISRKLPMMLPTEGLVLSWGVSPTEQEYIHTPDEQYHALMNHFTYNKTWLRSKFPADTAYISLIRDPSKQLRSAMNYYYIPQLLKIKSKNPVKTFLENPWRYKNRSEVTFAHFNVTWDPSRNFMAFDLGYPTEGVEDEERARRYVNELEADFTLVMLMDYVDESYVLLKRLMCWELQDVLYITKNNRSYSFKDYVPSEKETAMLRRWKAVDYLLHDTFNKSLWRKIAAQGPDFFEEVQHFKEVNSRVNMYCAKLKKGGSNLTVEASRWNSQFEVDAEFCRVLKSVVKELLTPLQKGRKDGRWKLVTERINMRAIVDGHPTFKYESERGKYLKRVKAAKKSKQVKKNKKRKKGKRH
ncbi:PREDICTED: galactose-3-O-sulfotransferase 4-like [Branchiostoma belcheri]|uniref:Galactose-3-O-sulfotransferase 4-like n=1 Tax=Branchiostoma belcheri TaxID=7741 RepID=A0A6P5AB61_BRABE|nr:PREDICTED: galactose-3-O-sulfotransferase 4-like [Branchiostoma belcheri]